MRSDQPGPLEHLKTILVEEIGLSEESAALLIDERGELDMQRDAMYCLWMTQQGKVHTPPAWLPSSLKGDRSAPHRMPSEWQPTLPRFRVGQKNVRGLATLFAETNAAD